jgi:hypothetical protein
LTPAEMSEVDPRVSSISTLRNTLSYQDRHLGGLF